LNTVILVHCDCYTNGIAENAPADLDSHGLTRFVCWGWGLLYCHGDEPSPAFNGMVFTSPGAALNEGSIGNRTVENRFKVNTAAGETKRTAC
jgi:hypothetical protein